MFYEEVDNTFVKFWLVLGKACGLDQNNHKGQGPS